RIRLAGQGAPGERGGVPGDLYLRITVRPHQTVRVEGRDLLLDLPITAAEALEGAEVTAPTFEGPVKLKIPAGSQSGRKLRLRGRRHGRHHRACPRALPPPPLPPTALLPAPCATPPPSAPRADCGPTDSRHYNSIAPLALDQRVLLRPRLLTVYPSCNTDF